MAARLHAAALLLMSACVFCPANSARTLQQIPGLASLLNTTVTGVYNLTNSGSADALIAFRDNITNFDEVATSRNIQGWNDTEATQSELCTWTGVLCGGASNNLLLGLNLPGYGFEGTLMDWNFTTFRTLNLSNNLFGGTLPDNVGSYWASMQTLDLSENNITGPLPPDWGGAGSFTQLQTLDLHLNGLESTLPSTWGGNLNNVTYLDLSRNLLTGSLPAAWGEGSGFSALATLNLALNLLDGTLPTTWGTGSPAGVPVLRFLNVSHNGMTGTLPSQWGTAPQVLPLTGLDVGNNTFQGTLPASWSYMSLANLSVAGNLLNGTLPAAWGTSGAWNPMARLLLDHNNLTGTLPDVWGTNGSMSALSFLAVNNNSLSGPIPAAWATRFAQNKVLVVTPGNNAVCGSIPSGLDVTSNQAFYGGFGTLTSLPTAVCPPSPPPPPASPPPPVIPVPSRSSSSSLSGGAIAGIVIGALAGLALLAGLLFFLCRRRRDRAGFGKQKSTIASDSLNSVPTSEEYRHLNAASEAPSSFRTDKTGLASTGTQNGHKMDSDELLSTGPGKRQRGTTVEMSSPESAHTHSTPTRSMASTQDWTTDSPGRQRNDPFQLPHTFEWRIHPEQLKIAKRPDGRDWKLGAGGFGTVYKAYKDEVQEVAVKIFKPEEGGAQAVESNKFQMEIAIMKGCRDRNIVQFYGACIDNDQLYMVTEFMEHGDLFTALNNPERGSHYSWYKKGRKIALDVARGLHYLHSNSVIHFDLKSANILLSNDDSAKLADVGLSHALTTKTHVVNSVMRGTWSWAAPETITGLKCTEKVDIWSYGIVLWELCTIEQPERGRNRPVRVPEECPKEIDQLIARCTDPNPGARPTAKQIIQSILSSPAQPPAAGGTPSAPEAPTPGPTLA